MSDCADTDTSFNTLIREWVINLILVIILHVFAYILVVAYSKKLYPHESDYEDEIANRVSFFISVFSLCTSMWATLLLPISVISNEVLHAYPDSMYINWLNSSLIQGFWKWVFLFSNTSLFVLLPFAFFFSESQGFSKTQKGIKARIYETFSVLALLAAMIVGFLYILHAIFDYKELHWLSVWNYFLPFLYSCVSFIGVLLLLSCTPVGFAQLFTVVGDLVMQTNDFPRRRPSSSTLCDLANDVLKRGLWELQQNYKSIKQYVVPRRIAFTEFFNIKSYLNYLPWRKRETYSFPEKNGKATVLNHRVIDEVICFSSDVADLEEFGKLTRMRVYLGYPVTMVCLIALTFVSFLMVGQNILELSFGIKTLPIYSAENFSLGISSLSALGPLGALFEIVIILYLWCSSVVGLYAMPFFRHLRPKYRDTSMTHIIGNCAVLLVLSSALPVLARTLGITNFDLLGDFGRIYWLGNFYIVLFYNIVFAVATIFCVGSKMTASMRHELKQRLIFLRDLVKSDGLYEYYKKTH